MAVDRVKFQEIVSSQLPQYVREDFPLLTNFLEQYYVSQEYQSGPVDILENIDQYVKVDELCNISNSTTLTDDISYLDTTVNVTSTDGFVDTNGIIKIDNEIIFYKTKTSTSFENCSRGFSGITTYITVGSPDELTFSDTETDIHDSGATVYNLNVLFLQQFFKKLKKQITPGFSDRSFYSGLDERNFIYNSDSFYQSKGTDQSYEILFRALYGEDVEIIRPSEFLLTPSNADYKVTKDFVVESIQGDPLKLKNLTLFQNFSGARGSVTNVQRIPYDNYQYYQISIDSNFPNDTDINGTVFGEFKPNPLTKLINNVSIGDTIIDVDSTIDFPEYGNLETDDVDGNPIGIAYSGKTINQFFNVSGVSNNINSGANVTYDSYSYAYVGINTEEEIRVRFTSTLKDFIQNDNTYYFKKDDTIEIKSLGYEAFGKKANNYSLNVKTKWKVAEKEVIDANSFSHKFTFYNDHFLKEGYDVNLENEDKSYSVLGRVVRVISSKEIIVNFSQAIRSTGEFYIENQTLKGSSSRYPYISKYIANVQNTYSNFNDDVVIATNSIPRYNNVQTNSYDKKITFSASLLSTDILSLPVNPTSLPDHGYYTGDSVYFESVGDGFEGVSSGSYFVFRIDESSIKLARSKADLSRGKYITFNGSVTNASLSYLDFYNKTIEPQGIYRKILNPINDGNKYLTNSGFTGIFVNGLELLNYKSQNSVYYGDILSLTMTSGGQEYDIVNPPILDIQDEVGTGATGTCNVKGQLTKIDVTDPGLGYVFPPVINIKGGNGVGAKAEAKLITIKHENAFVADFPSQVSLTSDQITFVNDHKFVDGENVIYQPRNSKIITGLSTEGNYYTSVISEKVVRLHKTRTDAIAGINTVDLSGYGSGTQYLVASKLKNVVSSVIVTDPGKNYENKKRTIPTVGVNTVSNRVEIVNHGYQSKEIVRYTEGTPKVNSLSEDTDYYVVKVNDNEFSLTEVGVGTIAKDYYYNNNILINFDNAGRGSFNYQPITVTVEGPAASYDKTFVEDYQNLFIIESPIDEDIVTPINTLAWTDTEAIILDSFSVVVSDDSTWLISDTPYIGNVFNYGAKLQSIFRGSIESVDLTNGGVGYGSSDIIDFRRQPEISFKSGSDAKLTPIINNGQITEVIINIPGTGYNSPPDLKIISDTGNYAVLVPIVENGEIVNVIVSKGGVGYVSGKTTIDVIAAGSGARSNANIRSWNINLFERNYNNILEDDSFIRENISNESLQYSSLYAPRPLRRTLNSLSGFDTDNLKYGIYDLVLDSNDEETNSEYHSPIVGWAYDGNPIYGPYGFSNIDGTGSIRRMLSGYKTKITSINRPSYDSFPNGFFVDDYIFTGDGDLDENNGRFCVTPDYPNGVYAYFCTISGVNDSSGPFNGYKRPVFPYVIGNYYKSTPIDFNFKSASNQTKFNIVGEKWFRNTKFYFTNTENSGYDYIFNSNSLRNQTIDVTATSSGSVESVDIIGAGNNYRVNDKVDFNTTGTGGRNLNYKVSSIKGKKVNSVSLATTYFEDVEFSSTSNPNTFVGLTSQPHNLLINDVVSVDSLSFDFKNFQGSYNIGVSSERWYTSLGIKTGTVTGIVTYVYVSGLLDQTNIRENDILRIESEKFKVLNLDKLSNRIRVLRGYDNTLAVAHDAGLLVRDDPRKIQFTSSGIRTTNYLRNNRQFYFAPNESLGIGSETVGTATTLVFSNPGVGQTQLRVNQQEIYLPDHNLSLNTPMVYYTNGGTSIQCWSGVENTPKYNLEDTRNVFAVPITKDKIGISTVRVGIDSISGNYVGVNTQAGALLYFTNSTGLGSYHSFNTNIPTVLKGRVSKNVVTVSTAQTHGLKRGDKVSIDVNPTSTLNVTVVYDDYNRRIVFDPDVIEPSGINTSNYTFTVPQNKYRLGDKIIYTSTDPSQNLDSNSIYYTYPFKNDKIKLVKNVSELTKESPNFIKVGSATTGTISRVNPELKVQQNQNVRFDLSDQSLSFVNSGTRYSAFDMFIYSDSSFNNKFWISKNSNSFEVTKSGVVGVDTNAYLNVYISDNIPSNLYYGFELDNLDLIPSVKSRKYTDTGVYNYNQINLIKNKFDGSFDVVGVTSNTFDYNVSFIKDSVISYGSTNAVLSYNTSSLTALGPIHKLKSINNGIGFKSLPGFTSVRSASGYGALLQPNSKSIGKILSYKFNNIGFGYPSDQTLNVVGNVPEIIKIDPLASFQTIKITSGGINYSEAPDLVVIDGVTNKQVTDLELTYELGDTEVTILRNTISLNNVTPTIVPINNNNSFSISSVTYNSSTKIVRLTLSKQFSDASEWPFVVGESVIVENVAIGFGTDGRGYNSENYDYSLFEVTSLDSQLGGSNAYIEYDLSDYLGTNEYPGNVTNVSAATVTPQSFFPTFDIELVTYNFLNGEKVYNGDSVGIVERWDPVSEYLFVNTDKDFVVGTIIQSETSNIKSRINSIIDFDTTIRLGVGATFIDGWQSSSGFLNDNLQVLPNNEYYQNFSYSLKSRIDFETWNDPVSSLNHTAGFDKYADLVIDNNAAGIATVADIEIETVVDLIGEGSLNCFPDFDGATESTINVGGGKIISNEIIFENKILVDYFESSGNRVLDIDDFSNQFNSNPRSTQYSIVDFFDDKHTFNKIFTLVRDTELRDRKQSSIVSVLQDKETGYVNQYGILDTSMSLGYFDYLNAGDQWGLTFYPNLYEYNNYDISYFTFSSLDNVTGIGSTDIGDVVNIQTTNTNVSVATTTTIVSISSTYRSAKVLIQLEDGENNYYGSELNLLHDGTNVKTLQFGDIDSVSGITSYTGFGTYSAYIDGSDIKVDIIPTVGTAITANVSVVSIADQNATGVSTTNMVVTNLSSYSKSIASSGSPVANVIASYSEPFTSEYFIVSVEDTTNNEYELFEVNVLDNIYNESYVEFAKITTNVGLGTVGVSTSGNEVNLTYTPEPNIDVEIRAFGISLKNYNNVTGISSINLNNNILFSEYGTYTGTQFDKKKSFNLYHNELPIFERTFLGNDSTVVNLTSNQVIIDDHYFVTGEKVTYSYENSSLSTANAIGIATTTVSGVSTDKLPTTLYVVKYSNRTVGFAKSATGALASTPDVLDLYSVGIGTFHKITSTNQNARALVAIDNMIQAPITKVNVETSLDQNVVFDVDFKVVGITSFKSNDLIQIDDEIMLIQNIGVGATNNFKVLRAQMGTEVASHNLGTSVYLLGGNYNIVDNTINFASAPYGSTPIGTTTGGPDEVDWTGITTYSSFQGRTFMRSGIQNSSDDTYSTNYTFDNIQSQFNGQKKVFSLTSNGNNITGFATNQAIILNSNILQEPQGTQSSTGDVSFLEVAGVTSITYLGTSVSSEDDPNKATIPRGGSIISVASTPGFGYQPLVSAGATVTVSTAGTITSVSIGNSGSGYRVGVQTVNVGIVTSTTGIPTIENIGTATVSGGHIVAITTSNFSSGLDSNNPPTVVIDAPLPYSSIPLVYADGSSGVGTGAKVDILVGQGSSVINFEIINGGFGYGNGEVLKVAIGGTTGIQTDTSLSYQDFELTITDVYRDTFNGFTIGELDVFDSLDDEFDGQRTRFTLSIGNAQFAIQSKKGSNINLTQTLIVTINDILQIPGESYKFNGGSVIEFTEPPKQGDTSKIIFYKGTPDIDVALVDIFETVKVGDTLQLKNDSSKGQSFGLYQDPRVVTGITTLDTVTTFAYEGPGISNNRALVRPITWCKQHNDISINGDFITKDRVEYEPLIYPSAYLTTYVGVSSGYAYVDTIRPLFDASNETTSLTYQDRIEIVDQSPIAAAIGTVTVSVAGTVTGFTISTGGQGYDGMTPTVSISEPDDIIGGTRATATASVTGSAVTSITITNAGAGYTQAPHLLIEVPNLRKEQIGVSSYFGDQGLIVGYAQSSAALGTLELYIPQDSFMRDSDIVGTAVTVSQLTTNDYFVVNLSNIGVSTNNFDGIYRVSHAYDFTKDLSGVGLGVTTIRRVEFTTDQLGSDDGIFRNENIYGEYTWGKIEFLNRNSLDALEFTPQGYQGLSTSPLVSRFRPLKYDNYTA